MRGEAEGGEQIRHRQLCGLHNRQLRTPRGLQPDPPERELSDARPSHSQFSPLTRPVDILHSNKQPIQEVVLTLVIERTTPDRLCQELALGPGLLAQRRERPQRPRREPWLKESDCSG